MASRRHPGERHRPRPAPLTDDSLVRMNCPCCGTNVVMLGSNLRRLADAAQAHFGEGAQVGMDLSQLPEANWAEPVPDEVIARAVIDAMVCET